MKKLIQKLVILTMLLSAWGTGVNIYEPANNVVQANRRVHHRRVKRHRQRRRKVIQHKSRIRKSRGIHTAWANVYLDISKKSPDYQVALDGINAWNETKAVKFRIVDKFSYALIWIRHGNYGNTGWAGIEQYKKLKKKRMVSEVKLNDFFMNEVDYPVKLAVVEHELGHSLGLEHNDKVPSVMTSMIDPDHPIHIQAVDIAKVKQLYHEK